MNDFNTNHGTWFDSRYPEYKDALDGAISSFQSINSFILNGLQTYYWDVETDKPIITEISQAHRNKPVFGL